MVSDVLHLCSTTNALQNLYLEITAYSVTVALSITSSMCIINAERLLWVNDDLHVMTTINFWFIGYPLCSFSRLLDEIRTNLSYASYSV